MSEQPTGVRRIQVRRGSSADVDAVTGVYAEVAAEGRWIGGEAPVEWTPERRAAWCRTADDEDRGAWFLAEAAAEAAAEDTAEAAAEDTAEDTAHEGPGATLAGYLAVTRSGTEHADFAMAVTARHRGQGVGGVLLDAAVAWCRAVPVSKLSCQVWPHNGRAIALYRSRGFLVEGRLRRHWRRRNGQLWDAVVMGLVLDERSPGSGLPDADGLG